MLSKLSVKFKAISQALIFQLKLMHYCSYFSVSLHRFFLKSRRLLSMVISRWIRSVLLGRCYITQTWLLRLWRNKYVGDVTMLKQIMFFSMFLGNLMSKVYSEAHNLTAFSCLVLFVLSLYNPTAMGGDTISVSLGCAKTKNQVECNFFVFD